MTLFDQPISAETYAAIRFGMGFPTLEGPLTPEGMLQRLLGPDRIGARFVQPGFAEATDMHRAVLDGRKALRAGKEGAEANLMVHRKRAVFFRFANLGTDLARAIETDDPLRERLQWFWTNHFATLPRNAHLRTVQCGYVQDAIRPNMTGRFADLLKAAVTHPVMLMSLDQIGSVGPNSVIGIKRGRGLNENLARELIELHTLGVGAVYSQTDVTQLAELLTGMNYTVNSGERFQSTDGRTGRGTGPWRQLRRAGGSQRSTISTPCWKTWPRIRRQPRISAASWPYISWPISPIPIWSRIWRRLSARSDGLLTHVYAAMLEHPAAWRDFGAKVKMPLDFMASALRAMGVSGEDILGLKSKHTRRKLETPLRLMGQPFNAPTGPDGFSEDARIWVQPYGLAARIAWAMDAAKRVPGGPPDPREFVVHALGDAASTRLVWAAGAAETRREGVGIVLSSAEFNRR